MAAPSKALYVSLVIEKTQMVLVSKCLKRPLIEMLPRTSHVTVVYSLWLRSQTRGDSGWTGKESIGSEYNAKVVTSQHFKSVMHLVAGSIWGEPCYS